MAHAQVRDHVPVREISIRMKISERIGLDRSADEKAVVFKAFGQIGNQDIADFIFGGMIEDESESAVGIVVQIKTTER